MHPTPPALLWRFDFLPTRPHLLFCVYPNRWLYQRPTCKGAGAQCCPMLYHTRLPPHAYTPNQHATICVHPILFTLNHPDVALCASYRTTSAAAAARPSHGAAWCAHHSSHTHTHTHAQYFMFVGLSCHPVAAQRSPQHTHSHITTEPR